MSSSNFCVVCGHHREYHDWWKIRELDQDLNVREVDRALIRITGAKCFGGSESDKGFMERYHAEFKENPDGFINCGCLIDVDEYKPVCRCRLFEDQYLPMHITG